MFGPEQVCVWGISMSEWLVAEIIIHNLNAGSQHFDLPVELSASVHAHTCLPDNVQV